MVIEFATVAIEFATMAIGFATISPLSRDTPSKGLLKTTLRANCKSLQAGQYQSFGFGYVVGAAGGAPPATTATS